MDHALHSMVIKTKRKAGFNATSQEGMQQLCYTAVNADLAVALMRIAALWTKHRKQQERMPK